jgi:hypothetical protein
MIHRLRLPRDSVMLMGLFAIGAASVLGCSWLTRRDADRPSTQGPLPSASPSERARTGAPSPDPGPGEARVASPPAEAPSPQIAAVTDGDSAKRAAAIAALANAPRSQAIPVLESVLSVADDVDRPLALRALRSLAQHQGDADDRIRSAVRNLIYHGSNEEVTSSAQATLDDIERDLDEAARHRSP